MNQLDLYRKELNQHDEHCACDRCEALIKLLNQETL